jgi:hypothetical protein
MFLGLKWPKLNENTQQPASNDDRDIVEVEEAVHGG